MRGQIHQLPALPDSIARGFSTKTSFPASRAALAIS